MSLNILLGTTGLLSLGHAAYFGAGAYTGAILFKLVGMGTLEAYILAGVVCSTALATVLGYFCVQATRMHFAILTLAFAQIVNAGFVGGSFFRLFGEKGWFLYMVGGGSMYIPRLTMLGTEYAPDVFIAAFYNYIAGGFLVTAFVPSCMGSGRIAVGFLPQAACRSRLFVRCFEMSTERRDAGALDERLREIV